MFIPFNYKQEDRFNLFNKLLKEEYPYIPLNKLDDIKIIEKYETELKKIYKKINGDLNVTSMILFSGSIKNTLIGCWNIPINLHPSQYYEYYSWTHGFNYLNYEYRIPSGCLYTGDINLKKDENIVKEIKSRLLYLWDSIGTIQIPHHGSVHNFSDEILSQDIKCAIISFGTTNTFGHPSDKIMGDILSKNIALYLVTENIETMVIQHK